MFLKQTVGGRASGRDFVCFRNSMGEATDHGTLVSQLNKATLNSPCRIIFLFTAPQDGDAYTKVCGNVHKYIAY